MPKSRTRRKQAYTPPPPPSAETAPKVRRWIAPFMVTMFLIGLVYLVVWYLSQGNLPIMDALGPWNVAVGFGFILVGFVASTQWR
ncbi:MAG TPA: cell division protein CrgA [Actinomycetes bacterium]|nr:cell division protein CrgA [Actinomycetes bacterium]